MARSRSMRFAPLWLLTSLAFAEDRSPDNPRETASRDPVEESDPASAPRPRSLFPPYLPRAAFVGAFANSGTVTPQLRLQWEITLFQEQIDSLVLLFEGGGGYGLSLPDNLGPTGHSAMTSLYQHAILAGLGFRADRPGGFHWGFQVTTGPLFYGARFIDLPSESGVQGLVEGRARAGWRFGSTVYGISLGYASLYQQPRIQSGPYLGGIVFGLFADAR